MVSEGKALQIDPQDLRILTWWLEGRSPAWGRGSGVSSPRGWEIIGGEPFWSWRALDWRDEGIRSVRGQGTATS